MTIRVIEPRDNDAMAKIIRDSLTAVGLDKPGTAYFDTALDDLANSYHGEKSVYVVADIKGHIVGGAGLAPIAPGICELQKCYVEASRRGQGLGRLLIERVLQEAAQLGYTSIYLETTEILASAVSLYESLGFTHLDAPLVNDNGHHAMTIWMIKDLQD